MSWETIFAPINNLKGVGVKTAANLASLGIYSIYDLLFYFPFRYEEMQTLPLNEIDDGQKVLLKGVVATDPYLSHFGYRKSRLSFKLRIDHDVIMVNFFNQPWLVKKIAVGGQVAIYGKYNLPRQSLSAFKLIAAKNDSSGMAAIYPVNKHIRQKTLIKFIKVALANYAADLKDIVPANIRQRFKLLSDAVLVKQMHQPQNLQQAKWARRSAIFREFFLFEMQLALLSRKQAQDCNGEAKEYNLQAVKALTELLPFTLSDDQKQAVNEIFSDLKKPIQMRRLLQGDVGSGKTIVAIYAIFAAITAGYQAAIMVPTEILATQHFQKMDHLLRQLGVRVALLLGSTKKLEKKEIYQELADGTINVVVGTQSLIQNDVIFKKLGLVIIDEQHRFGVEQRQSLINKGQKPDILSMTATPIPRTLALTVYGDMQVSEIKHLPAGRKKIISSWVTSSQMDQVYSAMKKQLAAGLQIYAVTPLIQESEKLDLKNAEELQQRLKHDFKQYQVVLLHGQMPGEKKEEIMNDFAAGKIDILVTTSVIEVGVDVAKANMMVIYDADRFGLSQLHQLRGRVGRSNLQSYCYFVADPKTEAGKDRMKIIAGTSNGFKLAEEDLKMRGQGDLFGKNQSGLPEFRVGNVVSDYNTLAAAHKIAFALAQQADFDDNPEYAPLRKVLKYKQIQQNR